jgi:CheY-like chemotaxis protein
VPRCSRPTVRTVIAAHAVSPRTDLAGRCHGSCNSTTQAAPPRRRLSPPSCSQSIPAPSLSLASAARGRRGRVHRSQRYVRQRRCQPARHGHPSCCKNTHGRWTPTRRSEPKYNNATASWYGGLPKASWPSCRLNMYFAYATESQAAAVISIVDDDVSVRDAMYGLVRSLGFEAATFSSAEEFLQSNLIETTSCLITDVQMPGLSGIELQSHLISQGSPVPVIFMTASPDRSIETRARSAGAVGFLSKPCEETKLIACVEQALSGSGEARH